MIGYKVSYNQIVGTQNRGKSKSAISVNEFSYTGNESVDFYREKYRTRLADRSFIGTEGNPVKDILMKDNEYADELGRNNRLGSVGVINGSEEHCWQGDIVYPNGARYKGQLKNGEYHGQGHLFYADGAEYEGQWENGKYHGQGSIIFSDKKDQKFEVESNKGWFIGGDESFRHRFIKSALNQELILDNMFWLDFLISSANKITADHKNKIKQLTTNLSFFKSGKNRTDEQLMHLDLEGHRVLLSYDKKSKSLAIHNSGQGLEHHACRVSFAGEVEFQTTKLFKIKDDKNFDYDKFESQLQKFTTLYELYDFLEQVGDVQDLGEKCWGPEQQGQNCATRCFIEYVRYFLSQEGKDSNACNALFEVFRDALSSEAFERGIVTEKKCIDVKKEIIKLKEQDANLKCLGELKDELQKWAEDGNVYAQKQCIALAAEKVSFPLDQIRKWAEDNSSDIGVCQNMGVVEKKDLKKYLSWLKKAALQGDASSLKNIFKMLCIKYHEFNEVRIISKDDIISMLKSLTLNNALRLILEGVIKYKDYCVDGIFIFNDLYKEGLKSKLEASLDNAKARIFLEELMKQDSVCATVGEITDKVKPGGENLQLLLKSMDISSIRELNFSDAEELTRVLEAHKASILSNARGGEKSLY